MKGFNAQKKPPPEYNINVFNPKKKKKKTKKKKKKKKKKNLLLLVRGALMLGLFWFKFFSIRTFFRKIIFTENIFLTFGAYRNYKYFLYFNSIILIHTN
jgi:hypothetical protein